MAITLLLSINAFATTQTINGVTVITVGSVGSTCDITTGTAKIQDGIDSNFSAVHIVNSETYNENIVIDDRNISIIGGFATCADAANGIRNPNAKSIINGSTNTQSTIRIFGDTVFHSVNLTGLDITGGTSNTLGGGGILAFGASVQIVLRNSFIHNNFGRFGGGIGILASSTRTNLFAFDTTISTNEADDGGGLYCNHTGSGLKPIIEFDENSLIANNSAINGGGAFLTNGCNLKTYAGIHLSTASQNGGGIYADNGAKVILYGHEECDLFGCKSNNISPVILNNNKSLFDGGGAYISGVGTELSIYAGEIQGNKAGTNKDQTLFAAGNGGGFYVSDGATLNVKRLTKECWDQRSCNLFDGNYPGLAGSIGRGEGGAIYNNNSTVNIEHTQFVNHLGYSPFLYGIGANSITNMNSSVIANNGGTVLHLDNTFTTTKFLSRLVDGAIFNIYHSTIADNEVTFSLFRMENSLGNTARMATSIVSPHSLSFDKPVFGLFSALASIDCTIVYEDASATSSFFSTVADPMFIADSNYRIDPINSPAVDYCFANHSNLPDIDFESRGIDVNKTNNFGPYDIGADEVQKPNEMFSDGFED